MMMVRGHVISLIAALLLLAVVTCPVTSQIHFSPTWGTGKRSERPVPAVPFVQSNSESCWTDSELRLVFQVAQMIKSSAALPLPSPAPPPSASHFPHPIAPFLHSTPIPLSRFSHTYLHFSFSDAVVEVPNQSTIASVEEATT
ncbi:hypothetical protein ACOMHN_065120 [Nucella lapillus]